MKGETQTKALGFLTFVYHKREIKNIFLFFGINKKISNSNERPEKTFLLEFLITERLQYYVRLLI